MHRIYVLLVSHTKNSRGFRTKREPQLVRIPNAIRVDAQIWNSLLTICRAFLACMKMPYRTEGTRFSQRKDRMTLEETIPPISACIGENS